MADEIIKEGMAHSEKGSWVIGFDEVSQHFDTTVTPSNGIGKLLCEELRSRDKVSELITTEDCLEMTYFMENVPPNMSGSEKAMTLFSLMGCNLEDVHIVDSDEEHDLATIVELNQNTLTEQGKTDWADVLGAKVGRVYVGYYGLQVEVSGCSPKRLESFSKMLAGECSLSDMNKWVNPSSDEPAFEQK